MSEKDNLLEQAHVLVKANKSFISKPFASDN
jgi:hypothetical protein